MAIDLKSLKQRRDANPPRILLYGPEKIGKSTFGSESDSPIFVPSEDGLENLPDTPAFPLAKSFQELMDNLAWLATEKHDFHTVVQDSADWTETLVWAKVAADNSVSSIEALPYGRGFVMAMNLWSEYLTALNYLRDERRMTVVILAHAEIRKYNSPEVDQFDRYDIKLHKLAGAKLKEACDIIMFANYRVGIRKQDVGFNQKRTMAVGSGERVLYTEERPTHIAGNRFNLPAEIPFAKDGSAWGTLASSIPFFNQPTKE